MRRIICEECKKRKNYHAKGLCKNCYERERMKNPELRRIRNEKQRRYQRKRYYEDLDFREKQLKASAKWIKNNLERHRESVRKSDKRGGLKRLLKTVDKYSFIKDKKAFILNGTYADKRLKELEGEHETKKTSKASSKEERTNTDSS